jgi:short-subunit dehydrogenase
VNTISCDLSKDNASEQVFNQVQQQGWQVEVLVNNAGFGEYGLFADSDLQKELAMIHLNVITLVHLTKLFLPQMLSRNSGRILQVGSVASFMPSPLQSVYGATKAFILSFSEALQDELKESNVTVTILCPPATDTNFFRVAGAQDSKMAQGNLATAEEVAAGGYEALMKGDARAVPTFKAKLEVAASTILPDSVMATAMHKQSEEKKPRKKATAEKEDSPKKEKKASAKTEPATKLKSETSTRKKKAE